MRIPLSVAFAVEPRTDARGAPLRRVGAERAKGSGLGGGGVRVEVVLVLRLGRARRAVACAPAIGLRAEEGEGTGGRGRGSADGRDNLAQLCHIAVRVCRRTALKLSARACSFVCLCKEEATRVVCVGLQACKKGVRAPGCITRA
eukprot:6206654-Pleurochrysis_carterae.AAC.6